MSYALDIVSAVINDSPFLVEAFQREFDAHPVCQRCQSAPSKHIPLYGKLFAVCTDCSNKMEQERIEAYKEMDEWDTLIKEEYGN